VQYFWALAGAALVLVLARHRWLALPAAALAAANLALIVPLYFPPPPAAASAETFRALSLNVHYINRDHHKTLELVRRERPDFLLFLEVTPQWAAALKSLDAEYPYWQMMPAEDPSGMAFFSRHKVTDISVKAVPEVGLPTIIAGLALPAGRLTVLCTHPASPGTQAHFADRNRQLRQVGRLARARSGPVMLLGDLNITSWSPYFGQLLADSGLVDSRLGFGVEGSWPDAPLPLRIPIDHCLVTPGVAIRNRRIGPSVGSDHRPLIVDFALPAESAAAVEDGRRAAGGEQLDSPK
jgi:endonuclease/exonuclease/phosphatase (EEP) superfamily protein YafD